MCVNKTTFYNVLCAMVIGLMSVAPIHSAKASETASADVPPARQWSFDGVFGTYDKAALQRGFQVYRQVCAACHSLHRVFYRNLADLGYSDAQIKAVASEYTVQDGPNDEGEMFDRPAKPSDRFASPYPNKQAAIYANGAYPPDVSLIVKAREGGADYVAALLTGFAEPPHGAEVPDGKYWNKYFHGHVLSMPPPLSDGVVAYEDGSPEIVSQYATDVANFLEWAAEPKMEQRKRTGIKAFLFLLVFAGIMYGVKKKVWADQH